MPPRLAGPATVVAAWVALYAVRVRDQFANVDDYLYAAQAAAIRHGVAGGPRALVHAWRAYPTSSPLVPALGAPLSAASGDPTVLVLAELPLLLALWFGVRALARCAGRTDRAATVTATLVAVTPAVLGYAVMWHFAIAASTALVWSLVAYLRSDRLRRRGWAVAFGVLVALLSLTRVVAVVYVAALAAVCAVDLVLDRTDVRRRAANLALALAGCAVVAAPWWLVTGRQAVRYLRSAGYDPASGFTKGSPSLPVAEWQRLHQTASETGLLVGLALVVLVAVSLARHRDRVAVLLAAVALGGLAVLGTSANLGTAFALPLEVVAAVVAAAAVRSRAVVVAVCAVAAVATLGQFGALRYPSAGDVPLWVESYPARGQAHHALGDRRDIRYVGLVNDSVAAVLSGTALVVRDDVLLNWPSLAARVGSGVDLRVAPYGAATLTRADLAGVTAVVAGRTPDRYHPGLDPDEVDAALRAAGFTPYLHLVLSPRNDVTVWRSG